MTKLQRRLSEGIRGGTYLALVCIGFALVVYAFRGRELLDAYNVTLLELLGAYAVAGIVGGCIVGLLLPLGRTAPGAALLGLIVALPTYLGFTILARTPGDHHGRSYVIAMVVAALIGPLTGVAIWKYVGDRHR